jgi:hypothetical protein
VIHAINYSESSLKLCSITLSSLAVVSYDEFPMFYGFFSYSSCSCVTINEIFSNGNASAVSSRLKLSLSYLTDPSLSVKELVKDLFIGFSSFTFCFSLFLKGEQPLLSLT